MRITRLTGARRVFSGLYAREPTRNAAEVLRADRPKRLVAVMKRDLSRGDSVPLFRKGIERSAGRGAAAIRGEIDAFARWFPTLREGNWFAVNFTPSDGVVVSAMGKPELFRGSVQFGTALFGMWLGPGADDAGLRASLLNP